MCQRTLADLAIERETPRRKGEGNERSRLAEDYSLSSRVGPIVNRNYSNFSIGWLGAVFARRNGSREGWPFGSTLQPEVCVQRAFGCCPGHFRYDGFPTPFIFPCDFGAWRKTADPRRSPGFETANAPPASHEIDRIQTGFVSFTRPPFRLAVPRALPEWNCSLRRQPGAFESETVKRAAFEASVSNTYHSFAKLFAGRISCRL